MLIVSTPSDVFPVCRGQTLRKRRPTHPEDEGVTGDFLPVHLSVDGDSGALVSDWVKGHPGVTPAGSQ